MNADVQDTGGGFVLIPGGTFLMGNPESEAEHCTHEVQHSVTVSSFYLITYPVTQGEYTGVTGNNPSYFKGVDLPVEKVHWFDAVEFCNKRNQRVFPGLL